MASTCTKFEEINWSTALSSTVQCHVHFSLQSQGQTVGKTAQITYTINNFSDSNSTISSLSIDDQLFPFSPQIAPGQQGTITFSRENGDFLTTNTGTVGIECSFLGFEFGGLCVCHLIGKC